MRLHIIQHVAFEGIEFFQAWQENYNITLTTTAFFNNEPLPDTDQFDFLIILGGPMGVADQHQYPWLKEELLFIRACIHKNKTLLGICLGAQLIAASLGAQITKNAVKEIGWFTLRRHSALQHHSLAQILPQNFNAFHWHGETFSLPTDAVPLASSAACDNQGFIYKSNILALQFHLEASTESTKLLIKHCRDELTDIASIQSEANMLSVESNQYRQAQKLMSTLLTYLLQHTVST